MENGLDSKPNDEQREREITILIVDDMQVGREILAALLDGEGFNLCFATSGPHALTMAAEIMPDLILSDVMMPGIDGFEVCRRLREHPFLAEVPILLLTALDDPQARLEGLEAGADDFIAKPFDRIELRARIRSILRLNRYRRLLNERAKNEEQLRRHAFFDRLTGLPNHTLFLDYLEQAIIRSKGEEEYGFAVLLLDFDRFKIINDSLGHDAGDQFLVSIVQRLSSCLLSGDILARLGGNEFAILIDHIQDINEAIRVADQINHVLLSPFNILTHEIVTTASIGIAFISKEYDRPEDYIRNAGTALYQAKSHGKAHYELFDASMQIKTLTNFRLETDLRQALRQGELTLFYQPIVSLQTNRTISVEALIRWQHPQLGMISPMEFIPLAEETGLIIPLGEWILRTACAEVVGWQKQGLPSVHVSVNLSPRQFKQKNIAEMIAQTLQETSLPPDFLHLELTETCVMENADANIAILLELKKLGVHLSIDDFGTGYSSLSYLKLFPIDTLKIDQSFVRDITTDPNDAAIASTIIVMAHNLKLKVIAEGVETKEQLAFLREHGCDQIQGYLYSRPVPPLKLSELLQIESRK